MSNAPTLLYSRPGRDFRVILGPGLVQLSTSSRFSADLQKEVRDERIRDLLMACKTPEETERVLDSLKPHPTGVGTITRWSAKSRANMQRVIHTLDLKDFVSGDISPCMITLTLPGDWAKLCPTAADASKVWHLFAVRWRKRWGRPHWIWKREFQRRGAPHWHVWTVLPLDQITPPPGVSPHRVFREWLSATWTSCLKVRERLGAEEAEKSLRAGTGIDFAEGLRSRDPHRLAVYFLKESADVAGKAYQNRAPQAWDGQSIGRFWGVAGLERVRREIDLTERDYNRLRRVLRHIQRAKFGSTRRSVERQHLDMNTGELKTRRRTVHRRWRGSLWLGLNDAPAVGMRIGRWLAGDSASPLLFDRVDSTPNEHGPVGIPGLRVG